MLYEQIASNKRKTVIFIIAFILLVQLVGMIVGHIIFGSYRAGIIGTTLILIIYMSFTMLSPQTIVMKINHAKAIKKEDAPTLYNIVEEVCISAGLKTIPEVYIISDDSPNAFATGISHDKAAVAITSGLLKKLNREELEGVIAHEIAHIMNYDVRLSTITIALLSVIIVLCDARFLLRLDRNSSPITIIIELVFMILAPVIAYSLQMAVSRNREYLADATAVSFTRNPLGLISALEKIDNDSHKVNNISSTCACMYIADPFKKKFDKDGKKNNNTSWFSTHPAIEDRIARLQKM